MKYKYPSSSLLPENLPLAGDIPLGDLGLSPALLSGEGEGVGREGGRGAGQVPSPQSFESDLDIHSWFCRFGFARSNARLGVKQLLAGAPIYILTGFRRETSFAEQLEEMPHSSHL